MKNLLFQKFLRYFYCIICMYCTFDFIFNLELLNRTIIFPISIIITFITSGMGLGLSIQMLDENFHSKYLKYIVFSYSIYLFVIQLLITILPGTSKCHCVSLKEVIFSIQDWSRVELATILLVLSIIMIIFYKKEKNICG